MRELAERLVKDESGSFRSLDLLLLGLLEDLIQLSQPRKSSMTLLFIIPRMH